MRRSLHPFPATTDRLLCAAQVHWGVARSLGAPTQPFLVHPPELASRDLRKTARILFAG